jgi:hypothetical protein
MIEFNAVAIAVIISVFFILSWFFSKSLMRGLVSVGISTVLITGLLFIAPLIFGWNFGRSFSNICYFVPGLLPSSQESC